MPARGATTAATTAPSKSVPRAGLDRAAVARAAAAIADGEGLHELTLARLAQRLGVRTPSLYNHVDGLRGLRRELDLLGRRELGARLAHAAIGRTGDDAVAALCQAYRAFVKDRPGLYAATVRASRLTDPDDTELDAAEGEIVEVVLAVLAPYGLRGDDAIHAVRALRSLAHGFATLEAAGGFGLALDRDESFRRLIAGFSAGLHTQDGTTAPHDP